MNNRLMVFHMMLYIPAIIDGKDIPSRPETVVCATAADFKPHICPISSSVFANGIALSKSSIAAARFPL